jgi:hypothetical protein
MNSAASLLPNASAVEAANTQTATKKLDYLLSPDTDEAALQCRAIPLPKRRGSANRAQDRNH